MPEITVTITSPMGLHARPAGHIARLAAASPHNILIGKSEEEAVDASSILSIMGLGLNADDSVLISAEESEAQPILEEIAQLIIQDGLENSGTGN